MEKEEFLMKLTGSEEEEAPASSPRLQYFNKVEERSPSLLLRGCCRSRTEGPFRCCDYWRTWVCPSW